MSYEQLRNQFGDSRNAVNYLPKAMRFGQLPDDLGAKIATVTTAVAAGAKALENPKPPATAPRAVTVEIPYIPIVLGVGAIIAIIFLLRNR